MLYGQESVPLADVAQLLQAAGTPAIAILTVGWSMGFVWRAEGLRGIAFVFLSGLGVGFNTLLKIASGPTPLMLEYNPAGLNFPSGHTVYAVTVFGALGWIAWLRRDGLAAWAFAFLVALMGPFRVIGEAHFVSDVVAGYLVGLAWLVPAAIVTGHVARPPPEAPTVV
jgi:undecaprenyl-diphosphatase